MTDGKASGLYMLGRKRETNEKKAEIMSEVDKNYPLDLYVLDGDVPVHASSMKEWSEFMDKNKILKKTRVGKSEVSSIFLGMDHNFWGGAPVLFETMIFGGPLDMTQERNQTKKGCLATHEYYVKKLKQQRDRLKD